MAPSAVSASPLGPSAPGQSSREPPSRPAPTVLVVAVVVAAAALAAVGAVLLAHSTGDLDRAGLRAAMVDWIVVPYVLGGLIAWRRRPESRFGLLMIAAGLAMAATTFQWSPNRLVSTIGQLVDLLPAVVFAHVFLAFPDGRLGRPPERLLVGVGYVTAVGGSLLVLVLGGFDARNLLTLTSNPGAAEAVQNVQLLVLAAVNLLGVLLLSRSRRGAGHAPRRLLALLADSFSLGLITFAALLVAGVFALPGFEQLRLVTFGVLGLAPVAFLGALLDARLARSGVAGLLVELHDHPAADLRDPLARALRDPTLTLAYWLPQYGAWADEAANAVPVPDPDPRRSVRVIDRDGEHVAALLYDRSLQDEDELVAAVSAAADIALENGRLQAELHARLQELHSSRTESSRPVRGSANGWNATCTTARSSGWSPSPELAVLQERLSENPDASGRVDEPDARDRAVAGRAARSRAWPAPCRAQRAWPGRGAGLARRASTGAGPALDGPADDGCRTRSRWRPTTSSPRASPTSASTRGQRRSRSTSGQLDARLIVRDRRRRGRRCRHRGGFGPARARRSRRGARRPAAGLEPRQAVERASGQSSHAGSDRRGQRPAARGLGPAARRRGLRRRRPVRQRRRAAAQGVALRRPDVVIVDIRLPPTHTDEGLRAALHIRERYPSVGVLVLSQYVEVGLAMKLLADSAEGVGYLLKDRISDVKEFLGAVRRVGAGGSALDPTIVSTLLRRRRSADPLGDLTPREREVLELMATGSSNQGIADALVITVRAVEKYVSAIFGKLGHSRDRQRVAPRARRADVPAVVTARS